MPAIQLRNTVDVTDQGTPYVSDIHLNAQAQATDDPHVLYHAIVTAVQHALNLAPDANPAPVVNRPGASADAFKEPKAETVRKTPTAPAVPYHRQPPHPAETEGQQPADAGPEPNGGAAPTAPAAPAENNPERDQGDAFANFATTKVRSKNAEKLFATLVEAAAYGYTVPETQITRLPVAQQDQARKAIADAKTETPTEAPTEAPTEVPTEAPAVDDFDEALGLGSPAPTAPAEPAPEPAKEPAGDDVDALFNGDTPDAEPVFEDWTDADLQQVLRQQAERLGGTNKIVPVLRAFSKNGAADIAPENRPDFVAELRKLEA